MRSSFTNLLPRTLIAACCAASCCGCGALGLYSLGHSLLAHNHVLKPVLPDDVEEREPDEHLAAEQLPGESTRGTADNSSSGGEVLPMERRASEGGAEASSDETSETTGE